MWPLWSPRSELSGRVRAVVDTNVWVSGLIVPASPPGRVLAAIRDRRLVAVASWALAEELVEVLRRPKLARYKLTEVDIVDVLALLAPLLPDVDTDPPLRDPDDTAVVSAALAGGAALIISGDADLLEDAAARTWLSQRGIEVLTPVEALARLGGA